MGSMVAATKAVKTPRLPDQGCSILGVSGGRSSLGPIDPQLGGIAAHGVVEEFKEARKDILADSRTIPLWQPIISQYEPTFITLTDTRACKIIENHRSAASIIRIDLD